MSTWIAYALGVVTLPLLGLLLWALGRLVLHDAITGRQCDICGYKTGRDIPIVRWAKWAWHDITRRPTRRHREGVDAYQREWGVGKYAEVES